MDPLLTLIGVFAIFIPALILPGPDFVAVVRSSMTRGAAAGMKTSIGVAAGLGLYAALSLLGLSAILVEYQWLAWTVRVLGGCYLVWLGIRLVVSRPAPVDLASEPAHAGGNPMLFGFLVTLTNPKAVVLFASVFAVAVTESTPLWLMALMVALVMASALSWYSAVSLFMASAPVIERLRGVLHGVERAAGVCFIAIGGKILSDARNPVAP